MTEAREAQAALDRARDAVFQSQKMEAIGQLTGSAAADFNNILAVIVGGLELAIKRLPESSNITPLLVAAHAAAQRGALLTQRMGAFARRQELKPEIVDALSVARGMTDLLQQALGPRVSIDIDFPATPAMIYIDVNQLELAMLNLALNAHDAMPNGGSVTIAAGPRKTGGEASSHRQYVCLSFTDSGNGMDQNTLARATEPFFSTKALGQGSGLGLSIIQGFLERSGGSLVLKSQVGGGTIAELWLPAAADIVPVATLRQRSAGADKNAGDGDFHPGTVH